MTTRSMRIAIVGLNFGESFVDIYRAHPDVADVGICDTNRELLELVGAKHNVARRYGDIRDIVDADEYDAVHLFTPIPTHAQLTLDVLRSGKHCACAVPMGTTLNELRAIAEAVASSGKNYMMMETAVYTSFFLMVEEMVGRGEFGNIQFLRGAHYQDMENWPGYWRGLPPMHYATHAIAPLLAISGARATKVHCFGSGHMREELMEPYGNPHPIECALFGLDRGQLCAEVTRSLFHTARVALEGFSVYGELASFEWTHSPMLYRLDTGSKSIFGSNAYTQHPVAKSDYSHLLPREIAHLTGGGHHGAHPHLAHEFVRSIVEGRKPRIDAATAANWTAAGICAHESAMNGGAMVDIPEIG